MSPAQPQRAGVTPIQAMTWQQGLSPRGFTGSTMSHPMTCTCHQESHWLVRHQPELAHKAERFHQPAGMWGGTLYVAVTVTVTHPTPALVGDGCRPRI